MPVVGAVLVLGDGESERVATLARLSRDPRMTLGALEGDRLPVVLVTDDLADDDALWREVRALPGVVHADVVFAALDEAADERAGELR